MKPLAIDLFCGLGGWTDGLLAEGYEVVGFDIERHAYGKDRYPAQLVLQDVLSLHGSQFRNAALIVASPPCQEFSYMAMPWSRAKQIAGGLRGEVPFPDKYTGSLTVTQLTALFDACFRIQREACESAGRHIPMVVENVKGAQPWVGMAKAHFGSFYFWGDIESVGGRIAAGKPEFGKALRAPKRGGTKRGGFSWSDYGKPDYVATAFNGAVGRLDGLKNEGGSWFAVAHNTESGVGQNPVNGTKGFATGLGMGHDWRQDPSGRFNSKSVHRKAASAQIAKIPFPLAEYIARTFKPSDSRS